MNYAKIKWYDIANGPGVRVSLYVSGCTHNCEDCFNKETHDFNHGEVWSKKIEDKIIRQLNKSEVKGLSVLGGEPLQQVNDTCLSNFLKRVKEETDKDIWLWTGYKFEHAIKDILKSDIMKHCDVIVDGRFEKKLADKRLKHRGSSNQRVIMVKPSMSLDKIVELEELK